MGDRERYFLKPDHLDTWAEVDEQKFIRAERNAGFRSKFGPDSVATGGFSGHGMRGRVVYPVNYDYYAEHEPTFHALLVPTQQCLNWDDERAGPDPDGYWRCGDCPACLAQSGASSVDSGEQRG